MADITMAVGSADPVTGTQRVMRFSDMGNGTWAEVVSTDSGAVGVTDILIAIGTPVGGVQIIERYKDMGDGTWARVVSAA